MLVAENWSVAATKKTEEQDDNTTVSSYTKLHTTIAEYGLIVGDEDEIVNYVSRLNELKYHSFVELHADDWNEARHN